MIPVTAGFIFPNGKILETVGKGHCRCARNYIIEHNLQEKFLNYDGAEDDFLIERLGAIKVCQYRGKRYVYMTKKCGWYINKIKKIYEEAGYIIKDCYIQDITIKLSEQILITQGFSYNQTVVKTLDSMGNVVYTYNPVRNGD